MTRIFEDTHCPCPLIVSRIAGKTRSKQTVSISWDKSYNRKEREQRGRTSTLILFTRVWSIQAPPKKFHNQDNLCQISWDQRKFRPSVNQEARVMCREQKEAKQKAYFH